jgi:hypothetical protein
MEKIIGDKTFTVRPLTSGEIKSLRAAGFNLNNLAIEQANDAVDAVIDMVYADMIDAIDQLPMPDVLSLFRATLEESYGRGESGKNS